MQIWPDGAIYEGYWRNDQAALKGRLVHADGDLYEGEWLNDKADGYGLYLHVNGAKYVGRWKQDKQNGYGMSVYKRELIITYKVRRHGQMEQDMKDFMWMGINMEKGNLYGLMDRFLKVISVIMLLKELVILLSISSLNQILGTYLWADGRKYLGQWVNNKMHGKGIFTWPDGRVYEGDYYDDKKQGQGIFIW